MLFLSLLDSGSFRFYCTYTSKRQTWVRLCVCVCACVSMCVRAACVFVCLFVVIVVFVSNVVQFLYLDKCFPLLTGHLPGKYNC